MKVPSWFILPTRGKKEFLSCPNVEISQFSRWAPWTPVWYSDYTSLDPLDLVISKAFAYVDAESHRHELSTSFVLQRKNRAELRKATGHVWRVTDVVLCTNSLRKPFLVCCVCTRIGVNTSSSYENCISFFPIPYSVEGRWEEEVNSHIYTKHMHILCISSIAWQWVKRQCQNRNRMSTSIRVC